MYASSFSPQDSISVKQYMYRVGVKYRKKKEHEVSKMLVQHSLPEQF